LIIGLILGVGGYWLAGRMSHRPAVQAVQQQVRSVTSNSLLTAGQTIVQLQDTVAAKLEALELQADTIQDELKQTGKVVRRKARDVGTAVADAAAEAQTTAAIKAQLVADPQLSAWDISVSTSGGVVTLSGTVSSPELIGRAMLLALETKNVTQVISTLQVK
jgi:osmotically-inducible protein OsmY